MKIKLLKTIGIIGCLGIVGATPVMLTSCKKKSTSQSATVTPQLKKSISGIGSLDEFITTSSKADDVNTNVKFVLNSNKESVIANWVCIPESEKNNISLDTSLVGWDNDNWGSMSFDEWNKTSNSTKVDWKGSKDTANSDEKLEFKSNKELRDFLNTNIEKIAKNAISSLGTKKASLADADIKVDENGNLLVAIKAEDTTKTNIVRTKRDVRTSTNYTLSIPSNVINFNPTINLKASFGNNQSTSEEVVFTYTVTSTPLIKQTFVTNSDSKKTITLAEMATSDNDSIGLWKTVTDEGILKALGWLDSSKSLDNEHVDGDGIDSTLLKEDTIISDLGIDGLTKEKLLGIQIEMKQRDVSKTDYNGEYNILVSTTLNNGQNTDLNLNFNTYKIVSQKSDNQTQHPLQVNVPNAYIIDTTVDGGKFMNITKTFFGNKSFEMGWNENGSATEILRKNLQNQKIFNKFIEKIDQSSKTQQIPLYNGVSISYKSNQVTDAQDEGFKDTITLTLTLNKGFAFKKAFTLTANGNNKYNTNGKTSEVTFGISLSNTENEKAIWKNTSKTVEQLATSLGQ
ncbi:hypothetical protein [Malacoplasma iowae]|uniref:hypothetical protein n=1 Tax=Malacoplasma iowae TaxID=2116 RepID=UPI002A18C7E7|nr:hypothetical protein [Malacoplasma iowae]WPL37796.1 hypothetical protein QX182_04815 [Malacoplasma iowae]